MLKRKRKGKDMAKNEHITLTGEIRCKKAKDLKKKSTEQRTHAAIWPMDGRLLLYVISRLIVQQCLPQ